MTKAQAAERLTAYPVESGQSYGNGERVHTVRITLMQWSYSTVRGIEIGGNTLGFDILDAAIGSLAEEIALEVEGGKCLVLTNPAGDTLEMDASSLLGWNDDEVDEERIKDLVVRAEIIAVRAVEPTKAADKPKERKPKERKPKARTKK